MNHMAGEMGGGSSISQMQSDERTIGRILLDAGKIRPEQAERILRLQRENGMRFGEAGKALGIISDSDIQEALSTQFDYPYVAGLADRLSRELVAAYEPFSVQVEALRALRTQLLIRWFSAASKMLAIVSDGPGDGRSFLAANLAVVFSQLGERTLLVDADLRSPRQHEIFGVAAQAGLSSLLAGRTERVTFSAVAHFSRLALLTAGPVPPNPGELLAREQLPRLLGEFAQRFDVVLIDTPPAGVNADAQTIATRAAGAIVLARRDRTKVAGMRALVERLSGSGVRLVGSVLNPA